VPHTPGQGKLSFRTTQKPKSNPPKQVSTTTRSPTLTETPHGTRHYPSYNINTEPSLVRFVSFLQTLDGKNREKHIAIQIAIDVSKYLKFASPESPNPDFEQLANDEKLSEYSELLKTNIKAAGVTQKLERLEEALHFYRVRIVKDTQSHLYVRAMKASESLSRWRQTLRKQRDIDNVRLLEEQSECQASMDDTTSCLKCEKAWDFFKMQIDMAENERPCNAKDLDIATHLLAYAVMVHSFQRPGAVTNLTLTEFHRMKSTKEGERWVLSVVNHKTASTGSAKLILDDNLKLRMNQYLKYIRPLQCLHSEETCPNFFLNSAGSSIKSFPKKMASVAERFGFRQFTSTEVRKVVSTKVDSLPSAQQELVARQLSHSLAMQKKHYVMTHSAEHAVHAHGIVTNSAAVQSGPLSPPPGPLSPPPGPLSPPPAKRRKFTRSEEQVIEEYFSSHIEQGKTPTIPECKTFLYSHDLQRTAKNIQDKVRGLVNNYV